MTIDIDDFLKRLEEYQPDEPVFDDSFKLIRNNGNIGYIHLAMGVIKQAIDDMFHGSALEQTSAWLFFYGDQQVSNYHLYKNILGYDAVPQIVHNYKEHGIIPTEDELLALDTLFKGVTVDALAAKQKGKDDFELD